ncbi:MAG: DMT family transporter [Acidobacteria bacterium]|nr:DMT family transporter [Acidobacteriota bacterium]
MKPPRAKLYGLISLMTLIWSINYIVAKIVLRSFPALLVGPLRAALAAALLLPVYGFVRWRSREKDRWEWRELGMLAVLGVFGITLNQVFFVLGMNRTSVAHAALVISTTPLQVMLLAALRGQERVTVRKVGGMLTAVAGIAVLNFGPGRALHGASALGDLFVFLAAFSFSVYTVFGKEVTKHHDSITVNSLGYFAGGLAGAPLLLQQSLSFDYSRVPASGWLALSYMALLSSVLCYFIFYYALNHLPASRVAAFSYMQPVIAAGAGWVILSEPVTMAVGLGGLLVLSGVWVTGRG